MRVVQIKSDHLYLLTNYFHTPPYTLAELFEKKRRIFCHHKGGVRKGNTYVLQGFVDKLTSQVR